MEFKDYYKILGVSKNASLENIKTAYRKLSKKFHPDVNNGDKFFEERFKEIQEAYEILSDISKRKQYDYIKDISTNTKEFEEKLRKKEDEFRTKEEDFLKREEKIVQKEKKINERENVKNNKEQSSAFKIFIFFLIFILFAIIFSNIYNQKNNTTNSKIIEQITNDTIINEVKSSINQSDNLNGINIIDKKTEDKFLITNNSAGFFKIGNTWNKIAKNEYKYQSVQGYGTCVDAACDGGFDLGKNLVINEDGFVENPVITIGALLFKTSQSFDDENERNRYINNKDVFFSTSSNLTAWYWKDKISYLVIFSEEFRTKEGIGVGVTLEKLEAALGKLEIEIGWLEEDGNAIQTKVNLYPDIRFILDIDDAIGGYEKLPTSGNKVIISDFKKNTKIKRIIINIKAKE